MSAPSPRAGHLRRLVERRFGPEHITATAESGDEDVLRVDRHALLALVRFLRDDRDAVLNLLVDLTVVDRHPAPHAERFLLVVRLRSTRLPYRARIEAVIPAHDPSFPSLTPVHAAADWLEREVHDLFGVLPDGHPFTRRLILYPGFAGHPQRRDYPLTKAQPLVPLREPPWPAVVLADGDINPGEGGA